MSENTGQLCTSRRLGFGRACLACRKRKHRCDATQPECSNCRSRGTVCEYSRRTATNRDISRDDSREGPPQPSPNVSPARTLSTGPEPGDVSERMLGLGPPTHAPTDFRNPAGYFGDSSAIRYISLAQPTERHPLIQGDNDPCLPDDIRSIYRSSPPDGLQFARLLPDRSQGNQLVDAYFARVHVLYPFVHETSFRSEYEQTWIKQSPRDIGWMAIVNMVFAYGCEFCPCLEGVATVERAMQFVDRAKKIILDQVFKESSLQLTQALLLLCHYLQGSLELNEAWTFFGLTVRSAMSIGLHVNPEENQTTPPIQREIRKRIWWGCFVLDRTLSMKFGRPSLIDLHNALDVDLPSHVDDHYITDSNQFPRQPGGHRARITAFIHTIGLSRVIDSILTMLYLKGRNTDTNAEASMPAQQDFHLLGNMLVLDGQLQSWWDNLPEYLTKASDLSEGIDLARQRNVLYIRYLQVRLLILRPSVLLLGKRHFQDRFLRAIATECAKRCVSAARETIQLVCQKYHLEQLHSVWYLLHYVFSSLGVLIAAQRIGLFPLRDWGDDPLAKCLDEGIDFCRSVGQQSGVAYRYMLLLDRHIGQLQENFNVNGGVTIRESDGHGTAGNRLNAAQDSLLYSGLGPGFHPTSVAVADAADFSLAMGLPVDFTAPEWLSYEGWPL